MKTPKAFWGGCSVLVRRLLSTVSSSFPVFVAITMAWPSVSSGQIFHGASIQKNPVGPDGTGRAHVGETITASIRVRNLDDFNDSLIIVGITDIVHHTTGDTVSPNLLSSNVTLKSFGDFILVTNMYPVQPLDGPVLTDDAQSGGIDNHDGDGGTFFPQEFFVTFPGQVRILKPAITVRKSCFLTGTPDNPTVFFTIVVSNSGIETPLTNVIVVDDNGTPGNAGDDRTFFLGSLAIGQTATTSGVYVATSNPSTNTVRVQGMDELALTVRDTNKCSVDIPCNPRMRLTKSCPIIPAVPGGVVTFRGTLTNNGNITLASVSVFNDQPSPNTLVIGPLTLPPNTGVAFTGTYLAPADACSVTDTLTATAQFAAICPGSFISTQATANCPLAITGRLTVVRFCPPAGFATNQPVPFSGIVSNAGNVTVQNINVTDSTGFILTPSNIPSLAPGQAVTVSGTYVATTCLPLLGTITATGTNNCVGTVTGQGSSTCTPDCGGICLEKTVTCSTSNGCDIAYSHQAFGIRRDTPDVGTGRCPDFCYRFVITNCGSATVTNVRLTDLQLGLNNVLAAPSLAAGATKTIYVTNFNQCFSTTNTASVSGANSLTGVILTATDTAAVIMARTAIECDSFVDSPDATDGTPGDGFLTLPEDSSPHNVTFSIRVTNTGDVDLQSVRILNVYLTSRGCTMPPLFPLAVGESRLFTLCTLPISCTSTPLTNTSSLHGEVSLATNKFCLWDNTEHRNVYATNKCQTLIECRNSVAPRICLTKTVTCSKSNGCDTVWAHTATGTARIDHSIRCSDFCYRFAITNCGNVPLTGLSLMDDQLDLSGFTLPASLAAGAGRVFYLTNVNHCENSTNTAFVRGEAPDGTVVTASDSASVTIKSVLITCERIINSPDAIDGTPNDNYILLPAGPGSHTVTRSVRVSNIGDLDLRDVEIKDDSLPTISKFTLRAGQTTNITYPSISVSCNSTPLTNEVIAKGEVILGTNRICLWDSEDQKNVFARSVCDSRIECGQADVITVKTANGNLKLKTMLIYGTPCVIEGATDVKGPWWPISNCTFATNGTSISVSVPPSSMPHYFYRIKNGQ